MRKWTMNRSLIVRRGLEWAGGAVAALIVAAVAIVAAVDTGHFRGLLIRVIAWGAGRPVTVDGSLEARIFSRHPRLVGERVTIGNPPWMPPGTTAEVGKISLAMETPRFGHSFAVKRLDIDAVTLHLRRDSAGHANWQWTDPGKSDYTQLPIIRSLSMPNAHVVLDDAIRHLQFDGTVSARDIDGSGGVRPLRIEGQGRLNGRPVTFEVDGDALVAASHAGPYRFTFDERSSGSRLIGSGFLPRPFDFAIVDTMFDASGADLKDLYFLIGVTLVHTGGYRLSGKFSRRGTNYQLSDLVATSGKSDMQGSVSIETSSGRPHVDAHLNSQLLRLADLGAHAGDSEAGARKSLLLSDEMLSPGAVRHSDAAVSFHARRVLLGGVPLQGVAVRMTIDHGVLVAAPVSADVLDGKLNAHVRIDASTDDPAVSLDIKIGDLQLGQLFHKGPAEPPMDGLLRARVIVKGRGRSVHQVAATANGTLTAALLRGTIRASLAELAGIDLRGLGLLLSKATQQTAVRCGVASFVAENGSLTAQSLVVDTDPVLISGSGQILLESEALDLVLRGHPKSLRLVRLRAPVLVGGTLVHPSIGINARKALVQTAAAVALGVVVTPLAAVLAFVDPGMAKDADCAALLAAAGTLDNRLRATPAAH